MSSVRRSLSKLHRWVGLTSALFLVLITATGSIIAFKTNLQQWLAPEEFVQSPYPGAEPLDWRSLHTIAELSSNGVADVMPLHRDGDAAVSFEVRARDGRPPLSFDTIILDPYSGREIKRVTAGDPRDGISQLVAFIETLHYSLALGSWGIWLLGIVAVIWTLDCFVGFYLTLPAGRHRWWRGWRRAWTLKLPSPSTFRLTFDLHRAAGLWLWPMLFIFAWSGVAFNMPAVYAPVMRTLADYAIVDDSAAGNAGGASHLDWDEALAVARRAASLAAAQRGFTIFRERELRYLAPSNIYALGLRTDRDRSDRGADSWVKLDGSTGALRSIYLPTGEHAGNTFTTWLALLHMAEVFGAPYRVFVSASGLLIVVITATGVLIWARKRRAAGSTNRALPMQ